MKESLVIGGRKTMQERLGVLNKHQSLGDRVESQGKEGRVRTGEGKEERKDYLHHQEKSSSKTGPASSTLSP